ERSVACSIDVVGHSRNASTPRARHETPPVATAGWWQPHTIWCMPHFLTRILRTGLVAGVVGTAAMDLLWFKRQRDAGSTTSFPDWEFGKGINSFDDAPAPAQVGR